MPKVTYTITAMVEVEVEMDEDLQDDRDALYAAAEEKLDDRLVMLDGYGARTGAISRRSIEYVQA